MFPLCTILKFLYFYMTASSSARKLPEDWDHFHVLLEQMLHRVPILGETALDRLVNGPEAFSPDCKWILGEAPEVRNKSKIPVSLFRHSNPKVLKHIFCFKFILLTFVLSVLFFRSKTIL